MSEKYMSAEEFFASLFEADDLEWHWTEDDKVNSEGKARVFGYTAHTPGKALRNIQYISAVGIDCDYCFEDDRRPATGYGKCECCNENVWTCSECAHWNSE